MKMYTLDKYNRVTQSIPLLWSPVKPPPLEGEMQKLMELDESLEKNVKGFIAILILEAVNFKSYGSIGKDTIYLSKSATYKSKSQKGFDRKMLDV